MTVPTQQARNSEDHQYQRVGRFGLRPSGKVPGVMWLRGAVL